MSIKLYIKSSKLYLWKQNQTSGKPLKKEREALSLLDRELGINNGHSLLLVRNFFGITIPAYPS